MAETRSSPAHPRGFFQTFRKDAWWSYPLFTVIVLGAFGVYSLWAAYTGIAGAEAFHYLDHGRDYLSPFYSPCITDACAEGPLAGTITGVTVVTPALFVMWMPLGLRATCYYYRKAYYRAFFASPVACSVDEPRKKYSGEAAFPFVLQNLHRYFLYLALLFPPFLLYDAWLAFQVNGSFAVTAVALVMLANALLLTGFTFGCHALRHWVGGRLNCFSCSNVAKGRYGLWRGVTWFNKHHGKWAWVSLVWVGLTDAYIRAVIHFGPSIDPILFGGA
ncbi:MAG: succinate dehydrogenase [Euryarchaeota archaeon]|nr:succinate dehydrogenase [Euryarchaeota archaeon]